MIVGDPLSFAIQYEVCQARGKWKYGMFNFVIDEKLIPGVGCMWTLGAVFYHLKSEFEEDWHKNIKEVGDGPVTELDLPSGEAENVIYIHTAELADTGWQYALGYAGEEERFFYSNDGFLNTHEKRLRRGTVEAVIRSLPNHEDI